MRIGTISHPFNCIMSNFPAHPLFPLLSHLNRYRDMMSFDPRRVPTVREIRRLLLENNEVKISPGLEEEDTIIREALSVIIQHIIHLYQTYHTFRDKFNALVKDSLAQIDTAPELETTYLEPGNPPTESPRYRSNHPPWIGSYLKRWLFRHRSNPYPSKDEKQKLAAVTGLTCAQISDWLVSLNTQRSYTHMVIF